MKAIQATSVVFLALNAAALVVVNEQIGPIQLLYQNDLTADASSTSALLLQKEATYAESLTSCQALSEFLLPAVSADIHDQLRYLTHSGQLRHGQLHLAMPPQDAPRSRARRAPQACLAYNVQRMEANAVDCNAKLPALCTQSAPPYNASQLRAEVGDERKVTVENKNYSITGYITIPWARQLMLRVCILKLHANDMQVSRCPILSIPRDSFC